MDQRCLVLILFSVISLSHQSKKLPPPPALTMNAIDVELDETETRRTNLFPAGPIATCSDDDQARAYIQSVSPASPCGAKCFNLLPCGGTAPGGNSSGYCLFYEADQGNLQYSTTPKYTLTVGCSDDAEPATTQTLTVTIVPNTPPVFNPLNLANVAVTQSGTATAPGDLIYPVSTSDIDGDPVYYTMTTNPKTDYISIGYTDGKIRAKNDLKFVCQDSVKATVTARDDYNPPIGPVNVFLTIDPSNKAPYVTNLDTTVNINENVGAGVPVLTLNVVDPNVYPQLNFHMWADSDAGMDQYQLETTPTSAILKTRINPNYERSDTRSVKLYFDVNDGYCKANKTYSLTVNIVDINEPPQCVPDKVQNIEVYEGPVNINTGMYVSDPDLKDVRTYSKMKSSSNLFGVDPNTGNIVSPSDIDIDNNTPFKAYTVGINVTDKGDLSCNTSVGITVYDANDQKPYFKPIPSPFATTECTEPGSIIGTVTGDDDDSSYNNNDKIYFGGGGGKMSVMSGGSVVLTQWCINGESFTGSATIADEGIYPGPLQGTPATISMTCGPCPTTTVRTPTPSPAATTQKATNAPAATGATTIRANATRSTDDSGTVDLLSWLVPAILGALAWLALSAFLIYRYCCPWRNPFAGLCRRRPKKFSKSRKEKHKKQKKHKKPKKAKQASNPPPLPFPPLPTDVTPPTLPPPLPFPPLPMDINPPTLIPPPREPESDPYIYGFWKKEYTDQDCVSEPTTFSKPKAVENMPPEAVAPRGNAPAPPNLRLGNPGIGQHNADLPSVSN
ncbi:hypothetical protein BsWGS_24170 [Bradybaena similaris]